MADSRARPASLSAPSPALVVWGLGALAVVGVVLFMTVGARGDWGFLLAFRGGKVASMILVGYAIGVSTVLFQTVARNRILTPSIMGFDSLYALIQTGLVFVLGSTAVAGLDIHLRFVLEAGIMAAFAGALYRWLFSGGLRGLHLLMLVGIVFGVLFRSLASFLQRIIDPTEFLVVQDRLFASFNRPDAGLLTIAAVVVLAVSIAGLRWLAVLDVLALGREAAINLGIDHRRMVTRVLMAVSLLIAVSTALVGPLMFLGLLVANLAYMLVPTHRHALLLPAAALIAIVFLTFGQLVLEHVLAYDTALGIVIEFVGGLFFLFLLLRGLVR